MKKLNFLKKFKGRFSKVNARVGRKVFNGGNRIDLNRYMAKAGINIHSSLLSKNIFRFAIALNLMFSVYLISFFAFKEGYQLSYISVIFFIVWVVAFFVLLALMWLGFYIFLDLMILKRRLDLEEVLPDFLYLAATNIRSGMTTDNALWFAVRPRFGVLAKEVESVAKEVMSGKELTESLQTFADKYDSEMLHRTITLINEGIKSGGEIGMLLTRIASNIQDSRLMKKEMAANVKSYVIFITFAAIIAAPILLALSERLIIIIHDIISKIDMPTSSQSMFMISKVAVKIEDFRIFAIVTLLITSLFSALIVATINKGNVQEGMVYIPIYIAVSIVMFWISSNLLGSLLSGIF